VRFRSGHLDRLFVSRFLGGVRPGS
jgi:hypothetical protein